MESTGYFVVDCSDREKHLPKNQGLGLVVADCGVLPMLIRLLPENLLLAALPNPFVCWLFCNFGCEIWIPSFSQCASFFDCDYCCYYFCLPCLPACSFGCPVDCSASSPFVVVFAGVISRYFFYYCWQRVLSRGFHHSWPSEP